MDKETIQEVKKKKEYSGLPDSLVWRALEKTGSDVKKARAMLRKYFGVFLTNRVVKGKGTAEQLLKAHLSSKKRDYSSLYAKLFDGDQNYATLVDVGCGINGLTFLSLADKGVKFYLGFEASKQVAEVINGYFEDEHLEEVADVVWIDLFDLKEVKRIIETSSGPRIAFLFQIVDALERFEKDFSKRLLEELSTYFEKIVISLPTESLGGRKKFLVNRAWLLDFLEEHFIIEKDFEEHGERFIVLKR